MRRTDDGSIAYDVAGNQGPRLVLVMGYGMRGIVWRSQIEALSDRCQVAWFDNRGIGDSAPIRSPRLSMRDMARDLASVMDALGWDAAHVAGVSMGGMIAQEFALGEPRRCRSLSLVVTHAGGPLAWLPSAAGIRNVLGTALAGGEDQRLRLRKELLYPAHFLSAVDPALMAARIAEAGAPSRDTARKQFDAIRRHRAGARLRSLRVPTLIIRAALDRVVPPRHSDVLHRLIPGARLSRFEDAGHGVIFQCGREVAERLHQHVVATERESERPLPGPALLGRQLGSERQTDEAVPRDRRG